MTRIASRVLADSSVRVLHIAGRDECDSVKAALGEVVEEGRYRVVDYIEGMGEALAASDLVIARAGATSIAEITELGVPSILVPYPFATDDHQTSNAHALATVGGARVVPDAELDSEMFAELVTQLLADDAARATMAAATRALGVPEAAQRVADVISSAARKPTGVKGETA
jgi:UDP-N-acetylglucosamine--N-acetylmuramyl-(pentapeptide) pyrophosphoryl-undecaprenol N-acetylglucosamine transferase